MTGLMEADRRPRAEVPKKIVAGPDVRQRRPRAQVEALIESAARGAFAEHGFAGATTREIAQRAGVSEVLIFRYFGNKGAMFDAVILEPFNRLIGDFLSEHRNNLPDRLRGNEAFVAAFYPFLRANADLLQALVKSHPVNRGADSWPAGLDNYFSMAASRMRLQFAKYGTKPGIDPDLGVRFGFGLLAAAILFEDWFFPDGKPGPERIAGALSQMIYNALNGAGEFEDQ